MKTPLISIPATEVQVGDIAHLCGARFEIVSKIVVIDKETQEPVHANIGKWVDGHTLVGYFGPAQDWNFQGNRHARVNIEQRSV